MRFLSPTHGVCENETIVVEKIFNRILANEHATWTIAIGTDSQNNKDKTRFCMAILLLEQGSGGSYFYSVRSEDRLHVTQNRMLKEAEFSIDLGRDIIDKIEDRLLSDELIDKNLDIAFEIHCDLGHDGKSRDAIKAAIGWITASFGGNVTPRIKPESPAASCIADKYTR